MNDFWNTSGAVAVNGPSSPSRLEGRCRSVNSIPVLGAARGVTLVIHLGLGAVAAVAVLRTDWVAIAAEAAEYWHMLTHGGGSLLITGP